MSNRLIHCLQKVTNKVEITDPKTGKLKKHDVFDHETKRGMIGLAQRKLASDDSLSIQDAEMEAVRELRAKVETDIEHVEAAVMAEAAPKAQLATARRPVDRDAKTAEAFARMHAHPEQAMLLAQRIQKEYQRVRAQTLQEYAYSPPESEKEQAQRRKTRAFAELDALVQALPPEIRGDIVGNTMSLAELRASDVAISDFMVKKIESIDRALEKYFRKIYAERIETLLKKARAKRAPSGVVKSTIGADAQDVVSRIPGYMQMSGEDVAKRYQAIEHEIAAGGLDPEEESKLLIEQHELSVFGATRELTAGQLEVAHADLQNTVRQGKAAWGAKEEARLNDQRLKAGKIAGVLGAATPPEVAEKNRAKLFNGLMNFARSHTSFVQLLERIFPGIDFIPQWQSTAIAKDGASMDNVRHTNERLLDAIAVALNSKSRVKAGSALKAMIAPNIPGPKGTMNKREAIQYLFAWGQPKVQERMRLHGWTDAHITVLKAATSDPASQALMAFFRQEYETIYQQANAVYKMMYGMNLPRIEGDYAPMRYHGAGGPADLSPTGAFVSSGVTPSAIKARVSHSAELRQVDALDVFEEHLHQMSHWIHFAEFIRETRGVLNNAHVKMSLEQSFGNKGLADLNKQLDAITRNGVVRASDVSGINGIINHLSSGVAVSAMAFNFHSAAVQGDAFFRWMAAIPIHHWWRPLALHQWMGRIPETWFSETVQRRLLQGTNPAIRQAMEQNGWSHPWLLKAVDIGFLPINALDAAGTTFSSAIVFADAKAQGMSDEQAMQKMDEAVARFAQPITVTAKSGALVNAGTAMKSLLMFMADPMLKTSIAMEGLLEIRRGNFERGARLLIAVETWALVSQLILNTWSHYGGDDDDDDGWLFENFWRAAILAPLQGFFVVGNVAEGIISSWSAYFLDTKEDKFWPKQPAPARVAEQAYRTLSPKNLQKLIDPSDPDFLKELSNIISLAGTGIGGGVAAGAGAFKTGVKIKTALEE